VCGKSRGIWIEQTEGAKFWLQVMTELKNRGVKDIFITCVDGLKGFPEAIEAVFPKTIVQLCIVHMVRYSLNFVSWKERKEVAADLRDLPCRHGGRGGVTACRIRGKMGRTVSSHRTILVPELGAHCAVLRLST
jgi:Transposase, Mutator family